jgi:hypothetical protein
VAAFDRQGSGSCSGTKMLPIDCKMDSTRNEVYEPILAGTEPTIVASRSESLDPIDRKAVLCSVRLIHDEVALNSITHARRISDLWSRECPFYVDGVATCLP